MTFTLTIIVSNLSQSANISKLNVLPRTDLIDIIKKHMVIPTFDYEQELLKRGYQYIAGIDESGRGAWAGPIVGAAVILPHNFDKFSWQVRDSKKLNHKQREKLYQLIIKHCLGYQISIISHTFIDKYGINQANARVIQQSALQLKPKATYILIDNIKTAIKLTAPFELINKGDVYIASIAAASIIAKVTRDRIMIKVSKIYPQYNFDQHKGYGTKQHQTKIKRYGPCLIHRRSYQPIKKYYESKQ